MLSTVKLAEQFKMVVAVIPPHVLVFSIRNFYHLFCSLSWHCITKNIAWTVSKIVTFVVWLSIYTRCPCTCKQFQQHLPFPVTLRRTNVSHDTSSDKTPSLWQYLYALQITSLGLRRQWITCPNKMKEAQIICGIPENIRIWERTESKYKGRATASKSLEIHCCR